jgi:phosphatidylglycerol:prolipoprotein diacylglycerol transferase
MLRLLAFLTYTPIVTLELGPLSISPHGMGTAIGFVAGAQLLLRRTRRMGISDELVYQALMRGGIGAVIGARVAYVVNHLGGFSSPLEWFAIWNGGISLLGGITGGLLAGVPIVTRKGTRLWPLLDAVAPGLALGIMIGRVGDLVVADHLGKPTGFVLGYACPDADTAAPCIAPIGAAVHQPALYDLFAAAALLALLLLLRRRPRRDGFLALTFGAVYGLARFGEDFFRIDETHGTGLTGSQWTALTVAALAWWYLLVVRRTPGRTRPVEAPASPPEETRVVTPPS